MSNITLIESILTDLHSVLDADGKPQHSSWLASSFAWSAAGGYVHTQRAINQVNILLDDESLTEERKTVLSDLIKDMETRCNDYLSVYGWAATQTSMDVSGKEIIARFEEPSERGIEIPEDLEDRLKLTAEVLDLDLSMVKSIAQQAEIEAKVQIKQEAKDSAVWVKDHEECLTLQLDAASRPDALKDFDITDRHLLAILRKADLKMAGYIATAIKTFLNFTGRVNKMRTAAAMQNLPHLKAIQDKVNSEVNKAAQLVESTTEPALEGHIH